MKILIVHLENERDKALKVFNIVRKEHAVKIIDRRFLKRELMNGKLNYDLIITVGGDGTFLRTAQFIDDQLVLGIRAERKDREGFLTSISLSEFNKETLTKLKVEKLPRLKVKVNNKLVNLSAVNDIFVGDKKPYKTAKYNIRFEGRAETQLSSGIIASTAIGTNAWFNSITGKSYKDNKKLYFAVREAYKGRVHKPKLLIGSGKQLEITALKNLILVFDSVSEEIQVNKGDKIKIFLDNNSFLRRLS